MATQIVWADAPTPGVKRPYIPILKINNKIGYSFNGLILGHHAFGAWIHWVGRTTPCVDDACQWCAKEIPRKWIGYLQVWYQQRENDGEQRMLELTPGCMPRILEALEASENKSIRCYNILIERTPRHRRGELEIKKLEPIELRGKPPEAIDLRAELSRLWKLNQTAAENRSLTMAANTLPDDEAGRYNAASPDAA